MRGNLDPLRVLSLVAISVAVVIPLASHGGAAAATAEDATERRLKIEPPPLAEGSASYLRGDPSNPEAVEGRWGTAAGNTVSLRGAATSYHRVGVLLDTQELSLTFDVDFETGRLVIDGDSGRLRADDMETLEIAYAELEASTAGNEYANLYMYRAVGMILESSAGFDWSHYEVSLPTIDADAPSFLSASTPETASPAVAMLRRQNSTASGVDYSDPSVAVLGAPGPKGGSFASCSSYPTDKADGDIKCVEYGNYYCGQYDWSPSAAGKDVVVKDIIPAVPPHVSREEAKTIEVDKGIEGAYPCSGRCGPGCKNVSGVIAKGGWGFGCLLHDQCVYQANGGAKIGWRQWENFIEDDCGMELMQAFDDNFMPPSFCPGNRTVGGSGKWRRKIGNPRRVKNKVRSTVTPKNKPIEGLSSPSTGGGSTSGGGGSPPRPGGKGGGMQ